MQAAKAGKSEQAVQELQALLEKHQSRRDASLQQMAHQYHVRRAQAQPFEQPYIDAVQRSRQATAQAQQLSQQQPPPHVRQCASLQLVPAQHRNQQQDQIRQPQPVDLTVPSPQAHQQAASTPGARMQGNGQEQSAAHGQPVQPWQQGQQNGHHRQGAGAAEPSQAAAHKAPSHRGPVSPMPADQQQAWLAQQQQPRQPAQQQQQRSALQPAPQQQPQQQQQQQQQQPQQVAAQTTQSSDSQQHAAQSLPSHQQQSASQHAAGSPRWPGPAAAAPHQANESHSSHQSTSAASQVQRVSASDANESAVGSVPGLRRGRGSFQRQPSLGSGADGPPGITMQGSGSNAAARQSAELAGADQSATGLQQRDGNAGNTLTQTDSVNSSGSSPRFAGRGNRLSTGRRNSSALAQADKQPRAANGSSAARSAGSGVQAQANLTAPAASSRPALQLSSAARSFTPAATSHSNQNNQGHGKKDTSTQLSSRQKLAKQLQAPASPRGDANSAAGRSRSAAHEALSAVFADINIDRQQQPEPAKAADVAPARNAASTQTHVPSGSAKRSAAPAPEPAAVASVSGTSGSRWGSGAVASVKNPTSRLSSLSGSAGLPQPPPAPSAVRAPQPQAAATTGVSDSVASEASDPVVQRPIRGGAATAQAAQSAAQQAHSAFPSLASEPAAGAAAQSSGNKGRQQASSSAADTAEASAGAGEAQAKRGKGRKKPVMKLDDCFNAAPPPPADSWQQQPQLDKPAQSPPLARPRQAARGDGKQHESSTAVKHGNRDPKTDAKTLLDAGIDVVLLSRHTSRNCREGREKDRAMERENLERAKAQSLELPIGGEPGFDAMRACLAQLQGHAHANSRREAAASKAKAPKPDAAQETGHRSQQERPQLDASSKVPLPPDCNGVLYCKSHVNSMMGGRPCKLQQDGKCRFWPCNRAAEKPPGWDAFLANKV